MRLGLTLLLAVVLAHAPAAYAQLAGSWSGAVTQPGATHPIYGVTMSTDRSGGGWISYPHLKCGGVLSFIESQGRTFSYREHITYGLDQCVDGGTLRLTPRPNGLAWYWSESGITASGILHGTPAAR